MQIGKKSLYAANVDMFAKILLFSLSNSLLSAVYQQSVSATDLCLSAELKQILPPKAKYEAKKFRMRTFAVIQLQIYHNNVVSLLN